MATAPYRMANAPHSSYTGQMVCRTGKMCQDLQGITSELPVLRCTSPPPLPDSCNALGVGNAQLAGYSAEGRVILDWFERGNRERQSCWEIHPSNRSAWQRVGAAQRHGSLCRAKTCSAGFSRKYNPTPFSVLKAKCWIGNGVGCGTSGTRAS